MKIVAAVVSLILFFGSLLLFGYAPTMIAPFNFLLFFVGILIVALSLAIPFHFLKKID